MEPSWKFAAFVLNLNIDDLNNSAFSHAWSLCVEEHFYLLFPVLAGWAVRHPDKRIFSADCALLVLAGVASRSTVWLHDMAVEAQFKRNWFVEDIYYPTWNRLDGLIAGVGLAAWKVYRPDTWARARCHAMPFF